MLESVFNHLYHSYYQDLLRHLFYIIRDRELAEDLVQEVYVKVYKSYDTFEGKSREKTWLFAIARNVAIDYLRKQKGNNEIHLNDYDVYQLKDNCPIPEEIVLRKDEVQQIYSCKIKPDQKVILDLRFIRGLSISETASTLGWSESKVKTLQHRAIQYLKDHYRKRAS
ncbi:sigma-70 family RNA polymerase sigma factor [Lederbergia wuyishanensis]|uniref:RNA polymerase sigma factor n=1 Tax=Lederbergia wuyishanensis TaxID=1347903 RepID=A0ABU0DA56_9BACI|nr:sigma-70 family RNA polymerase sigma factor [Lederbergia wuyishanensis]MCJ8009969.1 sigma-70 family RNA polymerase sigma factor [Lederbergia wuyishanensis]MDQ0345317.1 RNA polymerase sigma-70 factor (ECF subfamily) [Lederbergia wuyishanensis]